MKIVHEVFDHALKIETQSPEVKEKKPPPVE